MTDQVGPNFVGTGYLHTCVRVGTQKDCPLKKLAESHVGEIGYNGGSIKKKNHVVVVGV